MNNTISPCPFCGHDMEVKRIALQRSPNYAEYRWFGNCTNPKCVINNNYETEDDVIKALNTRFVDERIKKKIGNYKKKIKRMENRIKRIYLNGDME